MISRKRHAMKALTWRGVATLATIAIAWTVTGELQGGLTVGLWEFFIKMFLYYLHERFWYKFIGLGVNEAQPQ